MDFQKAFNNLFSFDTSMEAIIFSVILLITFVLGVLLWWLLAHFPQRRKLKNQILTLHTQLKTLDKEYEELEERHGVQSAKVKRLEEAAAKDELTIGNQEKRIVQLEKLYANIEQERDQQFKEAEDAKQQLEELKKLYKFAQMEILEANDKEFDATQAKDKALKRVEEMKGLIEEMEQDRQTAAEKLSASHEEVHQLKTLLAKETTAVEELKKDLGKALERLSAYEDKTTEDLLNEQDELRHTVAGLQDYIAQLENEQKAFEQKFAEQQKEFEVQLAQKQEEQSQFLDEREAIKAHNVTLIDEREQLQNQVEALAAEKQSLEQQLEKLLASNPPIVPPEEESGFKEHPLDGEAEDVTQTDVAELDDQLLDRRLEEAEKALNERGLFSDIDANEVIDNLEQLEESLAQLNPQTQARGLNEEEVVELNEEEVSAMNRALEKAENAMQYQGFFKELEESVILERAEEELDEETLMERALEQSEQLMNNNPFFEELNPEDLIEDQELLDNQLKQQPEAQARGLIEEEEAVEISVEEEELLSRALQKAAFALQEEGLYTEISPEDLLETEEVYRDQLPQNDITSENGSKKEVNIYQHIPPAQSVDNLKKINGIGATLEEKLNELGVSSYAQLTALDDEEIIHQLEALLEIPHNTIHQDQWITQAKQLSTKQKISNLTKDMNLNKLFKK